MKRVRQSLIGLVIAIGALYYTLRNVSIEELITSFKDADLFYIGLGLVITVSYTHLTLPTIYSV